MSTLLEQASLVLIPSGYKEDVVYSQIPTNGSGDLSFTRASNGTRVNSAGLVEVCPWNLLTYSEDFSNAAWVKSNATITANSTTAPNGTTTADTLTTTSISQCHIRQSYSFQIGVYTLSFYVKKVDLGFCYVEFGNAYCWVNLTTGAITGASQFGTGWTFVSASASSVGDGWFRVEFVASCSIAGTYNARPLQPVASAGTYDSGALNQTTFIWGAQLNIGSTAKPYFPTTDRLNVPRLTYQNGGGGCPSLLLEPQRTNLVQYSQALNTVPNVVDASTATANVYVSPDGTQNAMRFTEVAINDRHGFYQYTTVTAQTYTASIFTKQTGRRYIAFTSDMANGTSVVSFFDLQTISVVSSGGGHTCSIQDFGDGWLRLIVTLTVSAGAAGSRYVIWGGSPDGTTNTYTGSTSISQTFWGYQFEASSYPTSYIPTTSASATRVADACYKTGISSLIGQTEGTLFFELQRNDTDNDTRLQISDGSGINWLFVSIETGLNPRAYCNVGGVNQFSVYGSAVSNSTHKVALAYKSNDFKVYIDGVAVITQTSGSVPACNQIDVGSSGPSGSVVSTSIIKEVALFKTRLTNAELASLTTL